MIQRRYRQFVESQRAGLGAGFVAGLIMLFLILIGIPINIPSLGLFSLFLVIFIFGTTLARKLRQAPLDVLVKNALTMGAVAAIIVFLFMSLINRWQARGIDVKQYFDAVNANTMSTLSGVPASELFANPSRDLLTGDYPEGAVIRTNPMRLSFDKATGLRLQIGLTGSPWVKIDLIVGGFYGFMLLLVAVGLGGALITRGAIRAELGRRYRTEVAGPISGNPISHWFALLLPMLAFVVFWMTVGHGVRSANGDYSSVNPLLSLGSSAETIQLLLAFGIVLFGLVAMRATQPNDWNLSYAARVALVGVAIGVLAAAAIYRITSSQSYFIATSRAPGGSETLSVVVALVVAAVLLAQNALALRQPGHLETQFAASTALLIIMLMPMHLNRYQNDVMTQVGINVLLGLGLNIVVGYAGLLDLGYVAFFALGAYSYAFLSSNQEEFDSKGNLIGLKFAGNDDVVIKLAGWVTITAIMTAIVVAAGLYVWRRRGAGAGVSSAPASGGRFALAGRARRATATAGPARRPTLITLPERPSAGVTVLLAAISIAVSLAVAAILQGTGLYDRLFNHASPFLIGLGVGMIVSGLAGIALGIPVLRLRGDYLAIVTLGFGEIIRLLFNNLRDYTGGPKGVLQIPRPLPENASGAVTYLSLVYLVFIGAGLVAFFSARLKSSRMGRSWTAMRSDEDIAQSMGIHLVQSKLTAFAFGAAFAGIGGVLFAARQRNIFPNDFQLDVSIEVLSLVIIGGMGSIPGVIMGAVTLIGIPEVLRDLSTYRILVFGALLIVMVIVRPEGLLPAPMAQLQSKARALAQAIKPDQQGGNEPS
jgi:ABC-type branched-subunit amino acid transport system permease subunit